MKVLLINPKTSFYVKTSAVPLGLLSIATYIKKHHYSVQLYDRCVNNQKIQDILAEFSPDVVGVSLISTQSIKDAVYVSETANIRGIPVVWGGHMASIIPQQALQEGFADYIVFSEGEESFLELIQKIEKKESVHTVAGLAYLDESETMIRTEQRKFMDLTKIPPTDWSLIDVPKYYQEEYGAKNSFYIYYAKGCPHQCTFCFNKNFHHCQYRKRCQKDVMHEVRDLVQNYGVDGFLFLDETFGVDKKDLHVFCDNLQNLNLNFTWGCETRVGQLTKEDMQHMYHSGCRFIIFGVECGSKEILERVKKNMAFDKIDETFQNCREIGIMSGAYIMLGFPDETVVQMKTTVDLMMRICADVYSVSIYEAIPGTELYQEIVERGLLQPPKSLLDWANFSTRDKIKINYSNVPTKDLYVIQKYFLWIMFSKKDYSNSKNPYIYAKKAISNTFHFIFHNDLKNGFNSLVSASKMFLSVMWYAFGHPKIRKKYGLYKKNLYSDRDTANP